LVVVTMSRMCRTLQAGISAAALTLAFSGSAVAADSPLIAAIKNQDHNAARALLKQPARASQAEPDGTTPLHYAAEAGDLQLVQMLLKAGAKPVANRYGTTPLELAAERGDAPVIDALLQGGADAKGANREGETYLMTAARSGSLEAMRMLLARGADPNAQEGWYGETALMWAASQNHAQAIKLLIEAGAKTDTAGKKMTFARKVSGQTTLPVGSMTALMYAARVGALDATKALIEGGAPLDTQDPDGTTAMVLAIINGHYELAAMLLEKGANPNVADSAGMGALYAAVDMHTLQFMHGRPRSKAPDQLSSLDMVKLLLAKNPDLEQKLKTPLLRRHNSTSTQSLGDGTTPLMRAAYTGDVEVMRLLLAKGADKNVRQKNGTTLLMLASGFGRRGDHNADAQEYEAGTPAELLAGVKLCVEELGLDPNAVNDQGDAALHVAHSGDIARYLVAHGARVDTKNKRGQTPLAIAFLRKDRSNRQLRPDVVVALRELDGGATPGEALKAASSEPQP
jgi:ankyrin repeat protein